MADTPPSNVPPQQFPPPPPPAPPAGVGGAPVAPGMPAPGTPTPPGASGPASPRNRIAGVLALVAVALVLVGTALPIIEFDFGDLGDIPGVEESANGWSDDLNDGPIHLVVALAPIAAGIALLRGVAKLWPKVLLIVFAVIGFFWVFVRFADISGSLEDEQGLGDFVEEIADPGIGLYLMTVGWGLVLVAGLIATARSKANATPGAPTAF